MNVQQFRELAEGKLIASVVLYCTRLGEYEIWAYGDEDTAKDVNRVGNQLISAKSTPRIYTSLDRGYAAIREMGFNNPITIDG